jgi:hypothetical protein
MGCRQRNKKARRDGRAEHNFISFRPHLSAGGVTRRFADVASATGAGRCMSRPTFAVFGSPPSGLAPAAYHFADEQEMTGAVDLSARCGRFVAEHAYPQRPNGDAAAREVEGGCIILSLFPEGTNSVLAHYGRNGGVLSQIAMTNTPHWRGRAVVKPNTLFPGCIAMWR